MIEKNELDALGGSVGRDCPNCENVGWYMVPDSDGEPTPEQCQWCYTVEDSKFNLAEHERSAMSDTPRTDAQEWDWNEDCTPVEDMVVPASFARELERENDRLQDELSDWIQIAQRRANKLADMREVEIENIKLREALERFRGQFDCYECTGTAEDTLDSLKHPLPPKVPQRIAQ